MAVRLPRTEIWGDESGNLDFDPETGSKYFVVSTMTIADPSLTTSLLDLRRELDRRGFDLPDGFHATEDRQAVRDRVFDPLTRLPVRVDCTYYTKAKVYPRIRQDPDYFYRWAWFYHLRHVLPKLVPKDGDLFVGIATMTKKKRAVYAASHPCLQAADYYTWAIGRWLERGDRRSVDLVRHQIKTLYRLI